MVFLKRFNHILKYRQFLEVNLFLVLFWHKLIVWRQKVLVKTEFTQCIKVEGRIWFYFVMHVDYVLLELLFDHHINNSITAIFISLSTIIVRICCIPLYRHCGKICMSKKVGWLTKWSLWCIVKICASKNVILLLYLLLLLLFVLLTVKRSCMMVLLRRCWELRLTLIRIIHELIVVFFVWNTLLLILILCYLLCIIRTIIPYISSCCYWNWLLLVL